MRILYIFILAFICSGVFAQNFQREFANNESFINSSMAVKNDGGFYMLSVWPDQEDEAFKLVLTNHDKKSNILWSRDIEFEDEEFLSINADLIIVEKDTVVISALGFQNDGLITDRYVSKIDPQGNEVWNYSYGAEKDNLSSGQINDIYQNHDGNYIVFQGNGNDDVDTTDNAYIMEVSANGNLENAWLYKTVDLLGDTLDQPLFAGTYSVVDSSYVIAGSSQNAFSLNQFYISKLDTIGEVLWSRTYTPDLSSTSVSQVFDISAGQDSTILISGIGIDIFTYTFSPFALCLDIDGNVLWGKSLLFDGGFPLSFLTQASQDNGQHVIGGRYTDLANPVNLDFLVSFDAQGNLQWKSSFPNVNSLFLFVDAQGNGQIFPDGELEGTPSGGYLYSSTAFDPIGNTLRPFAVNVDETGAALCQDSLDILIILDLAFAIDTTFLVKQDLMDMDTVVIDIDTISYDLSLITLQDTMYCPQDPINYTLDATTSINQEDIDSGLAYEWSTGEFTPQITVQETGQYSVTVTFDTLACYTLCDTANVDQFEFPTAGIIANYLQYCEDETVQLQANISGGAPPFNFEWSTGETVGLINVTEFIEYSLLVTDGCGNSSMASVVVEENLIPSLEPPVISQSVDDYCETGDIVVFLENAESFDYIEWSNGEINVPSINIESASDITVLVRACDQELTGSISVDEFIFPETLSVSLNQSCEEDVIAITANIEGFARTVSWFRNNESVFVNGDTYSFIPEDSIIYNVTIEVTDPCGLFAEESIEVGQVLCDTVCLTYPNIFMPEGVQGGGTNQDSMLVINRFFAPYNACGSAVSEYEMIIVNRWGKELFRTEEVSPGWNGVYDGDFQRGDRYMYYASWRVEGIEERVSSKGGFTLLR